MDGEKRPLLPKTPPDNTDFSDDVTSTESSSKNSPVRINFYGTEATKPTKEVPFENRICYTWSDINAVTNDSLAVRKNIFDLCRKRRVRFQRKQILKNVNGVARPGEFLAILGSSGAGKTTLLNSLTFRNSKNVTVTGLRCMNGAPVSVSNLTAQSAYVQQDDLFIGSLTVKEHLIFQALLRMDKDLSYHQRMLRVNEVVSELALTKCKNTIIGTPGRTKGISGGERKRLSFAAEVLTDPPLLFCDEPTSGLDSFMALNVVQVLKTLAQTGKTVICTIHQPSSELYAMFDKILLMAEGRTAFLGTPDEAEEFFKSLEAPCPKNYNPADYYIQLLAIAPGKEESCRHAINMICDKFERSELGAKLAIEIATLTSRQDAASVGYQTEIHTNPYKASWFAQFRAVLWRSWISIMKEPMILKVRLLQTIMVALVFGAIYFGQRLTPDGVMNINGALFIFLTNMTFQNVFAVVHVFCSELPIFLREHRSGMYRTDVYFICKTLAEAPLFTLIPILFTALSYYLVGLNPDFTRFLIATGIVILVANVSTSFGYLISCFASSVSMALSIGPPLIVPFLLFGGFFLNINSIPVYLKWLSYFSWFKYGNEALMINQWGNVTGIDCTATNATCPADGHTVLEVYNFSEDNFNWDIIALVLLIIIFRFLAYLSLLWKAYRKE